MGKPDISVQTRSGRLGGNQRQARANSGSRTSRNQRSRSEKKVLREDHKIIRYSYRGVSSLWFFALPFVYFPTYGGRSLPSGALLEMEHQACEGLFFRIPGKQVSKHEETEVWQRKERRHAGTRNGGRKKSWDAKRRGKVFKSKSTTSEKTTK